MPPHVITAPVPFPCGHLGWAAPLLPSGTPTPSLSGALPHPPRSPHRSATPSSAAARAFPRDNQHLSVMRASQFFLTGPGNQNPPVAKQGPGSGGFGGPSAPAASATPFGGFGGGAGGGMMGAPSLFGNAGAFGVGSPGSPLCSTLQSKSHPCFGCCFFVGSGLQPQPTSSQVPAFFFTLPPSLREV